MITDKKISLIACVDDNYAIGYKNELLFHIPDDLRRFKSLTMGKTIIMGRKTYESIGKPLPGRQNIVLTSSEIPEVQTAKNIEEAVKLSENDIFIIGGSSIYKQFLPYANDIYLTEVLGKAENADAYFPKFDKSQYELFFEGPDYLSDGYMIYNHYVKK